MAVSTHNDRISRRPIANKTYMRRANDGAYTSYLVHPMSPRQQYQAQHGQTMQPDPNYVNPTYSCAPCPIPLAHRRLLYQAFKANELPISAAIDTEAKYALTVIGSSDDWVVHLRFLGDTPEDDRVEILDFNRDPSMWNAYAACLSEYESAAMVVAKARHASDYDKMVSVVTMIMVNADE